jgi:hypothetical protein
MRRSAIVAGAGVVALALRAASGLAAPPEPQHLDQQEILAALQRDRLLSPARTVLSAQLVCSLAISGSRYPIIDLVEGIRTAQSPRAYRRVILLKPDLRRAYELPYDPPAAPIACHDDVLEFSAPVEIANTLPEGRRVEFTHGGGVARVLAEP